MCLQIEYKQLKTPSSHHQCRARINRTKSINYHFTYELWQILFVKKCNTKLIWIHDKFKNYKNVIQRKIFHFLFLYNFKYTTVFNSRYDGINEHTSSPQIDQTRRTHFLENYVCAWAYLHSKVQYFITTFGGAAVQRFLLWWRYFTDTGALACCWLQATIKYLASAQK